MKSLILCSTYIYSLSTVVFTCLLTHSSESFPFYIGHYFFFVESTVCPLKHSLLEHIHLLLSTVTLSTARTHFPIYLFLNEPENLFDISEHSRNRLINILQLHRLYALLVKQSALIHVSAILYVLFNAFEITQNSWKDLSTGTVLIKGL